MEPGNLLRAIRTEARLTQTELAERAETTQAAVARVEAGRVSPTVKTLAKLLAACGRSLELRATPAREPSRAEQERVARGLSDVLDLAASLPSRPERELRFPRLRPSS